MRLAELLTPARVAVLSARGNLDKSGTLALLAKLLGEGAKVPASEIATVLHEREQLQSTGIGEGVAIPHGALASLSEQVAALVIVAEGVAFDAIDGANVTILFGLVGPKRATGEHLKTLARVAQLLRSADFRSRLMRASTADDAYALIDTEETSKLGSG